MENRRPRILLTGASGFIGSRLLKVLMDEEREVRCLTRSIEKFRGKIPMRWNAEVVQGDLLRPETLGRALEGMDVAYYLVHSMTEGGVGFADRDRRAAENFVRAADSAGLKRIIFLSGLGQTDDENLSKHLSSRLEVARILGSGRAKATVLRSGVILGAGSGSFEIVRYVVERLPVMICPRSVYTRCQPIAVGNVIEYLAGCLKEPATTGRTFDIGGPEITRYIDLLRTYARVRGLHRFIFTTPLFSPRLFAFWADLLAPVPAGLVRSLADGLKVEVIVREDSIRRILPVRLIPVAEAICTALVEADEGPGKLLSRRGCAIGQAMRIIYG